jgi:hypothetical protein
MEIRIPSQPDDLLVVIDTRDWGSYSRRTARNIMLIICTSNLLSELKSYRASPYVDGPKRSVPTLNSVPFRMGDHVQIRVGNDANITGAGVGGSNGQHRISKRTKAFSGNQSMPFSTLTRPLVPRSLRVPTTSTKVGTR